MIAVLLVVAVVLGWLAHVAWCDWHHDIHHYLSTACLHAHEPGRMPLHEDCRTGGRRWDGTPKTPATCKWCGAPCRCPCHTTGSRNDC